MNTAFASCLKASLRTTILLALCLLASAAVAGPIVDTLPVTRSARVSLAGLDLSTPEGSHVARERLRRAVVRLCGQVADELDLSLQSNFVACVDETLAAALRQAAEIGASTTNYKATQTTAGSITQAHPKSP